MLRNGLVVVGMLLLTGGLLGLVAGQQSGVVAVGGGVLVLVLLLERHVYKPVRAEAPGAGWERTEERFDDPGSGDRVVVYYHPRTGARRYVAESGED